MFVHKWVMVIAIFEAFSANFEVFSQTKEDDEVKSLPGLLFEIGVKQYSGYFNLSSGNLIHYWLVEAQNNPETAPLILWLNGGPGCSSLIGLFNELGPFHPSPDGESLFENIFSWNKVANLLFLEAPRDVGFSYRDPNQPKNDTYNDDYTALDNAEALEQLTIRFPEYKSRDFYILGESYAGVYVPTLTLEVIKRIQKQPPSITLRLVGMGLGNGQLSHVYQANAYVNLAFYRGIVSIEQYRQLKNCCPENSPVQYCNFSTYIGYHPNGNAYPIHNNDPKHDKCADLVYEFALTDLVNIPNYDPDNHNQDCYATDYSIHKNFSFSDQKSKINSKSTDPFMGFPCYTDGAVTSYLNLENVKDSIHIPKTMNITWSECSDKVSSLYTVQYWEDEAIFKNILATNYPLKILIMNGDLDGICSFLADEWFVENFSAAHDILVDAPRIPWTYRQSPGRLENIGGFVKKFKKKNADFSIDLVTVKGDGHLVPQDHPGPALNVIVNFLSAQRNYSAFINVSLVPKPLLKTDQKFLNDFRLLESSKIEFSPFQKTGLPDQVSNLPGLTYNLYFNQFSGYLEGSTKGNYLHYWLVASQNDPKNDPLVLWLPTGQGCSAILNLLVENGPFWPEPDGKTLFENEFSWNKVANILYLTPVGAGFSYQNTSGGNYGDDQTAADNLAALIQFFTTHLEYQGRDFYLGGTAYSGVYVPTLSKLLIQQLQTNSTLAKIINFKGLLIGNGHVSKKYDLHTRADFYYFHGLYGKTEWDQIRACCDPPNEIFCNLSKYLDEDGKPIGSSSCSKLVDKLWNGDMGYDKFNLYQDCYNYTTPDNFGLNLATSDNPENFLPYMNLGSTDPNGGFPCYMIKAAQTYLAQEVVRESLHIPKNAPSWSACKPVTNYTSTYNTLSKDLTSVFMDIFASDYVQKSTKEAFKILMYAGDADAKNSMMVNELFADNLVNLTSGHQASTNRSTWFYTINNWTNYAPAGWVKSYTLNGKISMDLLTIKGAGQFAATNRPGPSLQVFNNFLKAQNYSQPVSIPTTSVPSSGIRKFEFLNLVYALFVLISLKYM